MRRQAIASVLGAMVLVVLDAAIANVALPSIGQSLHATPARAVTVVTAYQLGLVMTLFPAAALGETLGLRRVFVAGTAIFTGASLACALAPSLGWLVAARFVQGTGGAAIMALGVALLRHAVPAQRLGAAIGWNALAVALSSAAGPTVGAMILSFAPWPWLFAVNLPIGAAVLLAARALPHVGGAIRAIDPASIALNAAAFVLFVLGAECAPSRPALAAAIALGAAMAGAVLIRREVRRPSPLVPIDLLRQPSFRVSVAASVLCFTGQSAALVALPFHLQRDHGLSPLMTGLFISPWPLAVALAGPWAGRLSDRVPTAWLCLAGGLLMAVGLGTTAWCGSHAPPLALIPCLIVCGIGFGSFNVPNNRNMFLSAPHARGGAAGAMQGVARLTGQTAGALLMTVLFQAVPLDASARIGFVVAATLTLLAGIMSLGREHACACSAPDRRTPPPPTAG